MINGESVPEYSKKGWRESRWQRVAQYSLDNGMREKRYWEKKETRIYRVCDGGQETWEHIWESCGWLGGGSTSQRMMEMVLGEERKGEEWLRRMEEWREGRLEINDMEEELRIKT